MWNTLTRNATALALLTALISGFSIFINKFAITEISDPVVFAAIKNSAVALLLIGIGTGLHAHTEVRSLSRKSWTQLALIGLIGGAVPFALFFTGLSLIPAMTGALIHKTLFVWVALLAIVFLREKFSPLQWLGVAALFSSNLVIGGFVGFEGSVGEWLVLAATLFWAFENILAKRLLENLSSVIVAAGRMVFGSLFLLAFLGLTGRMGSVLDLSWTSLGWIALTACLLLGYVLTWYTALKYAPASYVTALLVPATLVTNTLSAVFVTGTLTEGQVLSGFLAALGTVLVVFFAKQTISHAKENSLLPNTTTA